MRGPESSLFGLTTWFGGWALAIWGCVNYARWKGHSGWFGLMGYLLLPGLIILVCLPNKRKRMRQTDESGLFAEMDRLVEQDRRSGHRYLLTLLPLGVLFVAAGAFVFVSQSNIDPAEWKVVAPPDAGFQALMPGALQQQQTLQETPAGKVELLKLAVQPTSKKEMYAIVSGTFSFVPDEAEHPPWRRTTVVGHRPTGRSFHLGGTVAKRKANLRERPSRAGIGSASLERCGHQSAGFCNGQPGLSSFCARP